MTIRVSDLIDPAAEARLRAAIGEEPLERKDDTAVIVGMEHKSDPGVGGAQVLSADDDTGVVEAIVSVTGIEDKVKDIIEPGAYTKTMSEREPIGVWSHDDKTWVARTEEAVELPPGDPFLRGLKTMDGKPWPAAAGAVKVKARFNLETPHGKAAYSDVKFFQGKTGWSIGYRATKAHRNPRTGVRHIKELDWFEYSPVMVGAASQPMTLAVKSLAQPVDPDDPTGLVDMDTLEEGELKALVELKESLGLEVKDRVRTPEGSRKYGQPIGSVIIPDVISQLPASALRVGMRVDFRGAGPGGPSDPVDVRGPIQKVSTVDNVTSLTVGGKTFKVGANNPVSVDSRDMPADAPIRDVDLAMMIRDAQSKGQDEEVRMLRAAAKLPANQRRAALTGRPARLGGKPPAAKPDATRSGSLASRMRAHEAQGEAEAAAAGAASKVATDFPVGSEVSFQLRGKPMTGKVTGHRAADGTMPERVRVDSPEIGDIFLDVDRVKPAGEKPEPSATAQRLNDPAKQRERLANPKGNDLAGDPDERAGRRQREAQERVDAREADAKPTDKVREALAGVDGIRVLPEGGNTEGSHGVSITPVLGEDDKVRVTVRGYLPDAARAQADLAADRLGRDFTVTRNEDDPTIMYVTPKAADAEPAADDESSMPEPADMSDADLEAEVGEYIEGVAHGEELDDDDKARLQALVDEQQARKKKPAVEATHGGTPDENATGARNFMDTLRTEEGFSGDDLMNLDSAIEEYEKDPSPANAHALADELEEFGGTLTDDPLFGEVVDSLRKQGGESDTDPNVKPKDTAQDPHSEDAVRARIAARYEAMDDQDIADEYDDIAERDRSGRLTGREEFRLSQLGRELNKRGMDERAAREGRVTKVATPGTAPGANRADELAKAKDDDEHDTTVSLADPEANDSDDQYLTELPPVSRIRDHIEGRWDSREDLPRDEDGDPDVLEMLEALDYATDGDDDAAMTLLMDRIGKAVDQAFGNAVAGQSDRDADAEAQRRTSEREALAAYNRKRKAEGKPPVLRLPDSEKAHPMVVEFKGSRASLDRSPKENWVERAGELPGYIREVARAIEREGHTLSRAIAIAIGRIKRWALGEGDVKPDTIAKAQAAVAAWEALKAKSGKKYDSDLLAHLERKAYAEIDAIEQAWATLADLGEVKIVEDDGGLADLLAELDEKDADDREDITDLIGRGLEVKAFVEADHSRVPAGRSGGGRFAPKSGGSGKDEGSRAGARRKPAETHRDTRDRNDDEDDVNPMAREDGIRRVGDLDDLARQLGDWEDVPPRLREKQRAHYLRRARSLGASPATLAKIEALRVPARD